MKILKYIIILIIVFVCISCDCDEHIDMNTMIVIGEYEYKLNNMRDMSAFRIKYKSLNLNNGLDIYVVADKNTFEVGDKVKLVKIED